MKKIHLLLIFLFLIVLSLHSYAVGRITGDVQDSENFSLAGANVMVDQLGLGTATDDKGNFRLTNVPAGKYTLTVSYIGYQKETVEITVEDNKTSRVSVTLNSGVVIGENVYVLGDRLKGQAKALNQQKTNDNITNIVSSDQIGKFPDANVGDALKRIPAINVAYDQGEARFVNIRGTEPRLNSYMLNGERVPSAEGETRAVQLDLIPADMIQTIEVNKAVTPDMDGDAIGGAVNLVTRQAPNDLRISGSIGSGYNLLSEKPIYTGSAIIGQRFLDGRLGVIFSGSYHNHNLGSDNVEGEWASTNSLATWEVRKYIIQRVRKSGSLNMDFRLDDNSTFYFDGIYNNRKDWENRYRLQYKKLDEGEGSAELVRQIKAGINDDANDNARLEDQTTYKFGLTGDHFIANTLKFKWAVSADKASEERPHERYLAWNLKKQNVNVNLGNTEEPVLSTDADINSFKFKELTEEYQFTEEKNLVLKSDFALPLINSGDNKNLVKFGGKVRIKDKKRDNNFFSYELTDAGETMFASLTSLPTEDFTDNDFLAGNYKIGRFTPVEYVGSINLENSSLFDKTDVPAEYAAANFKAKETISAAYVSIDQYFGPKLLMLAGVRFENTSNEYDGFSYDELTGNISAKTGKSGYLSTLPSIHFRYNLDQNSIIRLAWTNTIARPNYYDLVPYRFINEDQDEVEIGNPELDPTTSINFDLMGEHYFSTVGIASAGLFYKKIDDYIVTVPVSAPDADVEVLQPINGGKATIFGAEFAIQRQFDFLPSILRNFGIYFNYTYSNGKADNPLISNQIGDKEIDLPGNAKHTLNTALTYQDQDLVISISYNHSSAYIDPDEVDLTPGLERYYDSVDYLDINGSYAFTKQLRFFFEVNNLLNQPLRYYAGDVSRTYQAEYYNARFDAGIKFDL